MRRLRHPTALLARPRVPVAAGGGLPVGQRVSGSRVDRGRVAQKSNRSDQVDIDGEAPKKIAND